MLLLHQSSYWWIVMKKVKIYMWYRRQYTARSGTALFSILGNVKVWSKSIYHKSAEHSLRCPCSPFSFMCNPPSRITFNLESASLFTTHLRMVFHFLSDFNSSSGTTTFSFEIILWCFCLRNRSRQDFTLWRPHGLEAEAFAFYFLFSQTSLLRSRTRRN